MKKIVSLLITAVLLTGTAFAEVIDKVEVTYDYSDEENAKTVISVSGQIDSRKANEIVSLSVCSADALLNIVGLCDTVTGEDGNYSARVYLPQSVSAADYKIRVGVSDAENAKEDERYIVTASAQKSLINSVNGTETGAAIQGIVSAVYPIAEYGLASDVYDKLTDKSGVYTLLANMKQQKKFDPEDRDAFVNAFMQATVLTALNLKQNVNLSEWLDVFPELDQTLRSDYAAQLTDKGRSALLGMVSDKGYNNVQKFCSDFEDAVILTAVSYPAKYGYYPVQQALLRYKTYLISKGFNMSAYDSADKDSVASELTGVYKSMSEFLNTFNQAVNNNSGGNSGGGSSGGSSGSSSGGLGGGMVAGEVSDMSAEKLPFDDISEIKWAVNEIVALYNRRVVSGDGGGYFMPQKNIKREEFAKMLTVAFSINGEAESFSDTPSDAWFTPHVKALYANNITTGQGDGNFGVGKNITREETAVMLYRVLKQKGIKLPEKVKEVNFTDESNIGEFASEAVDTLAKAGIISGRENGGFYPNDAITRAETAKLIYNVLVIVEGGLQ